MSMNRAFKTRASAGTTEILAAPGANKQYIIREILVTVLTPAASGKVFILDDTTEILGWDAVTAGGPQPPHVSFPKDTGPQITANKAIQLKTEGAIEVFVYVAAELRA